MILLDEFVLNPLMQNVPKWSDTLKKSCNIWCKVFKVCLTILGHYVLKGKFQSGISDFDKGKKIADHLFQRFPVKLILKI